MLGQYSSSAEAYLYWVKQGGLEFAASLDEREPPAGLEGLLCTIPDRDRFRHGSVELPEDSTQSYTVVRLANGEDNCVGIAALREVTSVRTDIPQGLLVDIGRALVRDDIEPR